MDNDPLARAVNALSFRALDLESVSATMRDGLRHAPLSTAEISIWGKHATSHIRRVEANTNTEERATLFIAVYRYQTGVRVVEAAGNETDTSGEAKNLLNIEAAFNVEYEETTQQDMDALQAFGQRNVPYHVWPYWRELVSSTVARMRFPHPVVVPHYVLRSQGSKEEPVSD